jgi:ATP-binding cassette subfamily F protein 3
VFEIAGREVNVFPGNYEDYLWRKEGKEIDLTLTGLPDLVGERALSPRIHDAGALPKAPASPSAVKSKRLNPIRLQQMKDRCHEIEEQVARLEAEIEGYAQELAHFRSVGDSARLAKSIEQGREEVARLMREWEDTAKVVEEQEAEVGE